MRNVIIKRHKQCAQEVTWPSTVADVMVRSRVSSTNAWQPHAPCQCRTLYGNCVELYYLCTVVLDRNVEVHIPGEPKDLQSRLVLHSKRVAR